MAESSKASTKAAASQMTDSDRVKATPAPEIPVPGTPPPRPKASPVPEVPLVARTVNPQTEIIYRNMLGAMMTVEEPALATFTSVTARRWGELSMDLGLGTSRPPKAHVGLDETKRFLFMAPTTKDDPMGLDVRYMEGRASINLITVFAPLARFVQPDRREYYDVGISPGKVKFDDGFESVSLYVYLVPTKDEPRRTMSEEAKAKLRATLARKKAEKKNNPTPETP